MTNRNEEWDPAVDALQQLHAEIDRATRPLEMLHAPRLQCRRGCSACCVDGLTVFDVEAENIRRWHADLLAQGAPHATGACAFLDESGACRIYEHRPYVCRTQGLPLRWIDESAREPVERRDICPLNDAGPPITALPEDACWTIGPYEERLGALQRASGGGMRRVRLRDLFARSSPNREPEVKP
jgi:uncharacterized protein